MTEEMFFCIFFVLFFLGVWLAAGAERLIERLRRRREIRIYRQQAAERKWRAEFFERYRREIEIPAEGDRRE